MRKALLLTSLVCLAAACNKDAPPSPKENPSPAANSSASVAKHAQDPAMPSSSTSGKSAEKPAPVPHKIYAFDGTIGKDTKVRLYLDTAGKAVDGLYVDENGYDHAIAGTIDGDKYTLQEKAGKTVTATIEGGLYDGLFKGTWKDAKTAKTQILITAPLTPPDAKFSESYVGALGTKLRIRAKLDADGGKITGVYRYVRSKADLTLSGTVDGKGAFALTESSDGKTTGKMEGYFLGVGFLIGRWSSADGSRSMPMTLRAANAYPDIVTLKTGGKIVPQEGYDGKDPNCSSSTIYPQFDGLASADAQKKLNDALKKAAPPATLSKDECEGATAEMPYEYETTYTPVATAKPYAGIYLNSYAFTGGAHGNYASECWTADLTTGALEKIGDQLTKDGKDKLAGLVNKALKANYGDNLADACFFDDPVSLGDHPNLCLSDDGGVDVIFNPYEAACYAAGQPSAHVAPADLAGMFTAGTLGAAIYK